MTTTEKKTKKYVPKGPMRNQFASEADMAQAICEFYTAEGWEVFEEVAPLGGGAQRADIVMRDKTGKIVIIECKMTMSLAVLNQGVAWCGWADEIYVAVPERHSTNRGTRDVATKAANSVLNIGTMYVSRRVNTTIKTYKPEVWAPTVAKFRSKMAEFLNTPGLQTHQAKAGSSGASFWTPYKETCKLLLEEVKKTPDGVLRVKTAVMNIKHHYSTPLAAVNNLSRLALKGAVPGLTVFKVGQQSFFKLK